jgi:hypothetical protein
MISEALPEDGQLLCETARFGAPFDEMMKASIFRPSEIEEINFSLGRHQVAPEGELRVPHRDEIFLLHYKYLNRQRAYARHQILFERLGVEDVDRKWGRQYGWSFEELNEHWQYFTERSVDFRALVSETYPLPRWWLPDMHTVPVAPKHRHGGKSGLESSLQQGSTLAAAPDFLFIADAIRRSRFLVEAQPNFFEFRGHDLYLHPPKDGSSSRLNAGNIAPVGKDAVFTCALCLDDRSIGPVTFRVRLFDKAQAVQRQAIVMPGGRRNILLRLDGFDGPLSIEFATEMTGKLLLNDFAWATFGEPRLSYLSGPADETDRPNQC